MCVGGCAVGVRVGAPTDAQIEYHVDHIRDGRSVRLRYVRAVQAGHLLASFMAAFDTSTYALGTPVMDHAVEMPDAKPLPEDSITTREFVESLGEDSNISPFIRYLQTRPNPIEIRPTRHFDPGNPVVAPPDK